MNFFALRASVFAFVALGFTACTTDNPASRLEQIQQKKLEKGTARVAECRKTQCQELDLFSASLADYSALGEMTHVTSLRLGYNTFANLDDLAAMQQLIELRVIATKIREVTGFARFENLRVLQIQSGLAADIIPTLRKMPELTDIAINLPSDGDISFLRQMPNLESISLLGSQVKTLAPLAGHPRLRSVRIHAGLPEDLSALAKIPNLKSLAVLENVVKEETSGIFEQLRKRGVALRPIGIIID